MIATAISGPSPPLAPRAAESASRGQLIARAFGSRVYQNDAPELGFTPLFPVVGAYDQVVASAQTVSIFQ